jgi:hypothetical protein
MCPSKAISATAAAGGWRQRNINIPKIHKLAAIGMANKGSLIKMVKVIPTGAETVFPAITAQG